MLWLLKQDLLPTQPDNRTGLWVACMGSYTLVTWSRWYTPNDVCSQRCIVLLHGAIEGQSLMLSVIRRVKSDLPSQVKLFCRLLIMHPRNSIYVKYLFASGTRGVPWTVSTMSTVLLLRCTLLLSRDVLSSMPELGTAFVLVCTLPVSTSL